MKFLLSGAFILFLGVSSLFSQQIPLKPGAYEAHLQLSSSTALPVRLTIETREKQKILIIRNAEERIELQVKKQEGDTFVISFPNFDSELRVIAVKKRRLKGFWVNHNKAGNYWIPFEASLIEEAKQHLEKAGVDITGNWEAYFSPGTADQEAALGVFRQQNGVVTGTFLTETGDYRFLEGTVEGAHFYLSGFDGSHAFLVTGNVLGTDVEGSFYSGKHYHTTWKATRNDAFQLSNADSLTYLKPNNNVAFTLKDLNGNDYTFPNPATTGKVVIIQIMGTWCPNCIDETKYYKELYAAYHAEGLKIIAIGYEAADSFAEQAAKIQRLKERYNLGFTFLVGGKANKAIASEQFTMLNKVMSFPTTIFIGKDGTVRRIHTGFSGPGTGSYYTEYVEKTNALIGSLLAE